MKINLQLPTFITILSIVAFLAGFYHVTNRRLDTLEKQVKVLKKANKKTNQRLRPN